jgi:GntR family transcriptional regulator
MARMATPLREGSGVSLHRQMFVVLRERILRGEVAAGDPLPSEQGLGAEFGVSRITVRRALADLAAQGYVQRRHGRGTFVLDRAEAQAPVASLNLLDSLRRTAAETEVEVLDVRRVEPPASVASQLQLPAGAGALRAIRRRLGEGVPLLLTEAWVVDALADKVTAARLARRALYEVLLEQGVRFGRIAQEITAEAADPLRAGWLETDISAPLLRLERLMHDVADRPVVHLTVWMAAERSRILMEIDAGSVGTLSGGHIVHDPLLAERPRARRAG